MNARIKDKIQEIEQYVDELDEIIPDVFSELNDFDVEKWSEERGRRRRRKTFPDTTRTTSSR